MQEKFDPVRTLLAAFAISSLGGLAALLRSKKPVTLRSALAATLYSGLMGLTIALIWYNYFNDQGNMYFLLGVSGLAGIGGVTCLDFVLQVIRNGGININIRADDKDDAKDDDRGDARGDD